MADQRLVADVWRCEVVEKAIDKCGTECSRPMHPMILEVALSSHEAEASGRIECCLGDVNWDVSVLKMR